MRILFLIYSLDGGGAERVTARLANQMAAEGHAVTIAVMVDRCVPAYPLADAVELIATGMASRSRTPVAGFVGLISRMRAVRRLLREQRADLAIGMMSTAAALLGLAGRTQGTVRIGAERIYPPFDTISPIWKLLRRCGYSLLDGMVVQTEAARLWVASNTRARRIAVIPNPLDTPPSAPGSPPFGQATAAIPRDARLVLGVGRLDRQKGFEDLIAAFAAAGAQRPQWHLAIIGKGPLAPALRQQADGTPVADRIHFPGFSDAADGWYRRADIFVLSSRFEGSPNALLEAMALGLACIAYDCPAGPSEIIEDGANGMLVEAGNVARLADQLAGLMDDEAARAALGRAARAITERHAVDRIARQWLDFAAELGA